jgi:heme A synthase
MIFALRWYFVMVPASLAIIFASVVFALYWHSYNNNGLGSEDSALFGWKFVPTLIAVIYTQLTSMILGALKRSKNFARLAKPIEHIPIARYTLLGKSRLWRTTLSHGFQKRRNGGTRNWAVILLCLTYSVAVLGILLMSAALLSIKEI